MTGQGLTVRVASWSAAHPGRAIVGWLVFVVMCVALGSMVGDRHATSVDYRVGEAGRAEAMAADGGLTVPAVEKVLITAPGGRRLDPASGEAAGRDVARRMRALPEVASVAAPVRSSDGRAVMVAVTMKGDQLAAEKQLEPLLAATAASGTSHPDVRMAETGSASVSKGLDAQRSDDLLRSEELTLPLTLLILLVVFGSVVAAGVPALLALSAIAASVGLSEVFSHLVPDAGVGAEIIILMGMAVGVDYSLFYVKREREERRRSGGTLDQRAVVELAARTSGRAIVVSAVGVVVSTVCLYAADDVIFASLATAAITVVLVAMASSLTVLPALLAKLGRRADRGRRRSGSSSGDAGGGRVWPALLVPATRRPVVTLAVAVAAMLALAAPALSMRLNQPGLTTFSRSIPAVATNRELLARFPDQTAAHLVVVTAGAGQAGKVERALAELARRAQGDPAFGGDAGAATRTSGDGRVSTLQLRIPFDPTSARADRSLTDLRRTLLPATVGRVPGARWAVSGDVARDVDYVDNQSRKTPWIVALVLLATFVMMIAAFRSLVIGLIAVVLNLLSAAAAFGALVLVFQHRWAEPLLGFTSVGFISARVPLFLFVILFGLSMDYQVFVVSRIREAVRRGSPPREAVREGVTGSAGVVTSAAVVMVSVFISFICLHLLEVKQIGFGLAVAVLVDAIVVRILILPALLTLLGHAAWWPSRPTPLPEGRLGAGDAALPTPSAAGR